LKVLITGATGYIGQRLTSKALQAGYEVVAFSRRPLIQPNVVCQQYNLTDKVLPLIPSDITAVIHLAANTQQIDLDEQLELDAAKRLIEAVNSIGATFIFVSSQTAKLNAPTAYGRIKWQIECHTLSAGGQVIRPGQVYGGSERGSFGELCNLVRQLPILPAFFPTPKVQPVHVDDLALAILACVNRPASSILCVAEPESISFMAFLQNISRGRIGKQILAIYVPVFLVRFVTSLLSLFSAYKSKLDRLESLFLLPEMNTAESLQHLQLRLRPFPAGITRSGTWRRELLMEGYALLKYILRVSPEHILVRRYVRCIETLGKEQAMMLPSIFLNYPALVSLLDDNRFLSENFRSEIEWRLNAGLLIAESSQQGAVRFLGLDLKRSFLRSLLGISRAVLSEMGRRIFQILLWPMLMKIVR